MRLDILNEKPWSQDSESRKSRALRYQEFGMDSRQYVSV